jgi:hypothetical protein
MLLTYRETPSLVCHAQGLDYPVPGLVHYAPKLVCPAPGLVCHAPSLVFHVPGLICPASGLFCPVPVSCSWPSMHIWALLVNFLTPLSAIRYR